MVGRPQKIRKIAGAPTLSGFRPCGPRRHRGGHHSGRMQEHIMLLFEEYESIRLLDYEGNNQTDAAELMHVSRPTLTRIYQRARQKVAQAFIEGRPIKFEGGNVHYETEWYQCTSCRSVFNIPQNATDTTSSMECPLCGQTEIIVYHNPDNLMTEE